MPFVNRSRFQSRDGQGRRRKVSWSAGPNGAIATVITSTVSLFPNGAQSVLEDLTIVRIRGELLVYLSLAGGAKNEGYRWAFGMANVTENAFGIGVTAVPAPLTDIGWDGWMVHHQGQVLARGAALKDGSPTESQRVIIDSKAMRKVHNTDVLMAVFETTEVGAGAEMEASLVTRLLDKLP